MAMRWQKKRLKGMSLVEMLMAIFILLMGRGGGTMLLMNRVRKN